MPEGSAYEPDTAAGRAEQIIACLERTLAAPSARMRFIRETDFSAPEIHRRRRHGGLLRPVGKLAKQAIKTGWKLSTHGFSITHLAEEGFIEPAASRYAVDFGSYAELSTDGQLFGGLSGRALSTLEPWPKRLKMPDPWWMLAVLRGATEADQEESEAVAGKSCKRFSTRVDLARASDASPSGLHTPSAERFEDLHRLPLTVWHDGEHIYRIGYAERPGSMLTLELWDFGVPTNELDWTHLPTFKSPKRAAELAGELPWHRRAYRRVRKVAHRAREAHG